jgi:hypothetical protein
MPIAAEADSWNRPRRKFAAIRGRSDIEKATQPCPEYRE